MKRNNEIRALLRLSEEEILARAGDRLLVCNSIEELHHQFANDIYGEIRHNLRFNKPTRLILPVGPVGQYPILAALINLAKLDLSDCFFFFMDEYCDEHGMALPVSHPLSFQGVVNREFFNRLKPELLPPLNQVFFPNEHNLSEMANEMAKGGGIDTCYGGIGFHGHLAFNEPAPNIECAGIRKVSLNAYTITMNAIRAQVGGNLENFPRYAFTIGMAQILNAKRIRLYCRNGGSYDWANTVLRLALFGTPGEDYPVTYIRNSNYAVITDRETLRQPPIIL